MTLLEYFKFEKEPFSKGSTLQICIRQSAPRAICKAYLRYTVSVYRFGNR